MSALEIKGDRNIATGKLRQRCPALADANLDYVEGILPDVRNWKLGARK